MTVSLGFIDLFSPNTLSLKRECAGEQQKEGETAELARLGDILVISQAASQTR